MEEKLINYLLGELPEEEEQQLEEHYLWDEEQREQLNIAEDELIYAYARGELSAERRASFEKHFLISDRRQQRLRMARAMISHCAMPQPAVVPATVVTKESALWQWLTSLISWRQYSFGQFAMAAMIIILMAASSWLMWELSQQRSRYQQLQAETAGPRDNSVLAQQAAQQRARADELARQLEIEKAERKQIAEQLAALERAPAIPDRPNTGTAGTMLSFTLTSVFVRGGAKNLTIPNNAETVEFRLALDEGQAYQNYQAQLLAEGTKELWQQRLKINQQRDEQYLIMRVPARLLAENDYLIKLSGITEQNQQEEVTSYSFRIVRR